MKILTRSGEYIDAMAVFFELTDEQLEAISKNNVFYLDRELLETLSKAKGDNAHFFGLFNTNGHLLNIHGYFKNLLETYKTISWWDKDLNKFQMIRR